MSIDPVSELKPYFRFPLSPTIEPETDSTDPLVCLDCTKSLYIVYETNLHTEFEMTDSSVLLK